MRKSAFFGCQFYAWGGFYQPKSPDERPIPQEMAYTLERWRDLAEQWQLRSAHEEHPSPAAGAQSTSASAPAHTQPAMAQKIKANLYAAPPDAWKTTVKLAQDTSASSESAKRFVALNEGDRLAPGAARAEAPEPERKPAAANPEPVQAKPARLSKKEKILQLARQHARTPTSGALAGERDRDAEEARKAAEEAERAREEEAKQLEAATIRDRLLKLMGRWR